MQAIRVRYTVQAEFVPHNRANIAAVMAELRERGDVGVAYVSMIEPDGVTFVHLAIVRDEAAEGVIPSLPAFKAFQAALRPNLVVPPQSEKWEVVDRSF